MIFVYASQERAMISEKISGSCHFLHLSLDDVGQLHPRFLKLSSSPDFSVPNQYVSEGEFTDCTSQQREFPDFTFSADFFEHGLILPLFFC